MTHTTKITVAELRQTLRPPAPEPVASPEPEFSIPSAAALPELELEVLRTKAQRGLPAAQYQLGLFYASAAAGHPDYTQAATWIGLAAEQGYAPAQSVLGWLYSTGYGVRADDAKAGYWYQQAALQGSCKDQYMVATMYRWGRYGVTQDLRQMLLWYQRAARAQFAPAQYALGKLLYEGKLVPQDLGGALQWLSLAVLNRSQAAQSVLTQVMAVMSPEQLARAQHALLSVLAAERLPAESEA